MGRRRRRGGAPPTADATAALSADAGSADEAPALSPADKAVGIAVALLLNIVPLWGVLAGEWSIAALMVLFWLENVFAGIGIVARMAALPGPSVLQGMKFAVIPFFLIHYGMFTLVHGMFVFLQFVDDDAPVWRERGFWWAVAVALAVQAWQSWRAHRDYVAPAVTDAEAKAGHEDPKVARGLALPLMHLMGEPYLRVGILHVVIVIGAVISLLLGTPLASLLLLIALKAAYEIAQATGTLKRLVAHAR